MALIAGEVFAAPLPAARPGHWLWTSPHARLGWWGRAGEPDGHNLTSPDSPLRIAADVRLDDRVALAAALGADPHRRTDADLLLLAYGKWGEACLDRLFGDFAFIIWDGAAGTLFGARDHFGVAPFFYRDKGTGMAVASRLADITDHADLVEASGAQLFVMGIEDDPAATILKGVQKLPAGHKLRWTAGRLTTSPYWRCEPLPLPAGEDFAQGFRERLVAAVDDRMGGRHPVGAMLSGGLDSSSIVSIAATALGSRRSALQTFSFAYPHGSPFDERSYVESVLTAHSPSPHFVDMTQVKPLSGVAPLLDGRNDLFFAPGAAKIMLLLQRAAAEGVVTMLDGHGGDEVASHGFGRLADLARTGRWLSLLRELMGVSRIFGESPWSLFAGYYVDHGRGGRTLRRLFDRGQSAKAAGPLSPMSFLNGDKAAGSGLAERLSRWRDTLSAAQASELGRHRWSVTWPGVAKGFETLRRMADSAGLSLRFPFYDRRLVSYALAVPDSEKLRNGWSRAVLRTAMTGLLPDRVRLRPSKIDFRGELAAGLAGEGRDELQALLAPAAPVGDYVDLGVARRLAEDLVAAPQAVGGADLFALWRIVVLARWLERRAALAPLPEQTP